MDQVLEWLQMYGIDTIITLLVVVVIYYIGIFATERLVKKTLHTTKRNWHRKDIEKRQRTLTALFKNIWRTLVIAFAILIVFSRLFPDVSLAPLFASAGIIGVAFGFGAQSLVKDFISGIFIISENQYRVGDIITVDGASGKVEKIGVRSTALRDQDGNVHYFPNGMVQHVINKTMDYSFARFSISAPATADLDKMIKLIDKTGIQLASETKWQDKILEAPAFVSVDDFSPTAITLSVAGKTQPSDQWAVISEMRRRLLVAFEKDEGISAPSSSTDKK